MRPLCRRAGSVDLVKAVAEAKRQGHPYSIMFVGINGTGKTTSIAKITRLLQKSGFSVVLASGDTYRAGAIEQLEEHARRLDVKVIRHQYGSDAAAVGYDAIQHAKARGIDVVLIDTAGRMQTNRNLMDELTKIKRVVQPDLTVMILDSLIGNDATEQALTFNKAVGFDATILTKVDADAKGWLKPERELPHRETCHLHRRWAGLRRPSALRRRLVRGEVTWRIRKGFKASAPLSGR